MVKQNKFLGKIDENDIYDCLVRANSEELKINIKAIRSTEFIQKLKIWLFKKTNTEKIITYGFCSFMMKRNKD